MQAAIDQHDAAFSEEWRVLAPFQIGTRGMKAIWSADPLEYYGGFRALEYDASASFRSSLAFNGTVSWSTFKADISQPGHNTAAAELTIGFDKVDWRSLQDVYGWAALQWQGWARGEIYVHGQDAKARVLHAENILEFWIDGVHYFGGDFYGFGRAPLTLHLQPGSHRIDVRLVRDARAMGAVGEPSLSFKLRLEHSHDDLVAVMPDFDDPYSAVQISDIIGNDFGPLASPYASVTFRNDALKPVYITTLRPEKEHCKAELVQTGPIRIEPGQSRPVAFRIGCISPMNGRGPINIDFIYHMDGSDDEKSIRVSTWPRVRGRYQPQKMTFLHPAGIVSYAILRPPSENAQRDCKAVRELPVLLALHGAGVEADSDELKQAFDHLPDLCAWVLFPTGGTPWSADDWHVWGLADVEAAISAIPQWIEQSEWTGPGVDVERWLVSGHSNGGQGTYYLLTHRPDKIIAATPLSGYSSIQNYVPYTFWHTAEPAKMAIVEWAMSTYRHELLLDNIKGIPILQQHGSADDNVPAYHSRMLSQRLQQTGAESAYVEMEGKPHWWDGVMTTQPLADFYKKHLALPPTPGLPPTGGLLSFTVVSGCQGDVGPKYGVQIQQVLTFGRLGKIRVAVDPRTHIFNVQTSNVLTFRWPAALSTGEAITVDGQKLAAFPAGQSHAVLCKAQDQWQYGESPPGLSGRARGQPGGMDAILLTKSPYTIVYHCPAARRVALQISRNLFEYYGADSNITAYHAEVTKETTGNLITLLIGQGLPYEPSTYNFPIEASGDQLKVWDSDSSSHRYMASNGLFGIWLQPLPDYHLELVLWGEDEEALDTAARLVPMLTGSGQPDFIIADKTMLWKGVEGALALGFFSRSWWVSSSSFFS